MQRNNYTKHWGYFVWSTHVRSKPKNPPRRSWTIFIIYVARLHGSALFQTVYLTHIDMVPSRVPSCLSFSWSSISPYMSRTDQINSSCRVGLRPFFCLKSSWNLQISLFTFLISSNSLLRVKRGVGQVVWDVLWYVRWRIRTQLTKKCQRRVGGRSDRVICGVH